MYKTKAILTAAAFAASALFVMVAIWPVLKGGNSDYQLKPATETVSTAIEEEVAEIAESEVEAVTEEVEAVVEEAEIAVEAVTEEVVVVEEAIEAETAEVEATTPPETVEEVVEETTQEVEQVAGQIHVVTAQGLKFDPLVVFIAPGDTVAWENMSSHDTQAFEDLIPEGAEVWHSGMGENYQHTFSQEGIYIYKCTPHIGAGMGGVVIVGKPVNLDAIKAATVKGAAKRLVKKAIKAVEAL